MQVVYFPSAFNFSPVLPPCFRRRAAVSPSPQSSGVLPFSAFTFISDPQLTAIKGTTYSYTPNVFTDEQTYEVILLNGPEGVIVENNVLTWDVPADAESDYIELRAETDNGDIIDQTYFVHVHGDNSLLKRSTTIVKYEALNGGILIGWTGGAAKYQVQHASTLTPDATTYSGRTSASHPRTAR
jgi:hypothetical protein